jgi:C-terminal processing protease CtpA/Prc
MRFRRVGGTSTLLLVCLVGVAFGSEDVSAPDSSYETDMDAFVRKVDEEYPFFELKGIRSDWADAKKDLKQRAKDCKSDQEFLLIIYDVVRTLRAGHMGLRNARVELPSLPPRCYPGISFLPATNGRVVIMYAPEAYAGELKTGVVVTKIDGADARQWLEKRTETAWNEGGFFSSFQRARLFEYRRALRGEQGEKHTISCLVDGHEKRFELTCDTVVRGWPHTYNMPADLKRVGRSFYYTKLASDVGYMYLRRVDASVPAGIDEAVEAHPDVLGWIIDLRGNGGGGYGRDLIERMQQFPRPAAVLIDAGCMSAGETLARDFRALADARVFGSNTAGSSSAKRTWTFPSGIASISFPARSRWRGDRKPIEFNGIDPDVEVEAVPKHLLEGNNTVILRAQEYIAREAAKRPGGE